MRTMRSEGGTLRDSRRNPEGGVWCSAASTGVHNAGSPLADDGATGGVQPFVPCSGRSRPRGGLLSEVLNDELARPCRDGVGGVSAVGGEHALDMRLRNKNARTQKSRERSNPRRGSSSRHVIVRYRYLHFRLGEQESTRGREQESSGVI